jgi:glycosyltransferase involved in cell wall biosynthesis
MAEAMACGTPVISFDRGAAREVVADGKTGFIVDDFEEMIDAVGKIERIDPLDCRNHVAEHFNVERMVDDYIRLYEEILTDRTHLKAIG